MSWFVKDVFWRRLTFLALQKRPTPKESLAKMKESLAKMKESLAKTKESLAKMKESLAKTKESLAKTKESLVRMRLNSYALLSLVGKKNVSLGASFILSKVMGMP